MRNGKGFAILDSKSAVHGSRREGSAVKGKKDSILILVLAAAALILLLVGLGSRRLSVPPAPSPTPETAESEAWTESGAETVTAATAETAAETAAPAPEPAQTYEDFVQETVAAYFAEYPAESYLIVTTGSGVYSPIPLTEDNSFRISRQDGSENVIHIGKNSFYMESSNCENQNCVEQGEVTLENRDRRLLFNMVICLPHNLSLELKTREETEAFLTELYTQGQQPSGPQE